MAWVRQILGRGFAQAAHRVLDAAGQPDFVLFGPNAEVFHAVRVGRRGMLEHSRIMDLQDVPLPSVEQPDVTKEAPAVITTETPTPPETVSPAVVERDAAAIAGAAKPAVPEVPAVVEKSIPAITDATKPTVAEKEFVMTDGDTVMVDGDVVTAASDAPAAMKVVGSAVTEMDVSATAVKHIPVDAENNAALGQGDSEAPSAADSAREDSDLAELMDEQAVAPQLPNLFLFLSYYQLPLLRESGHLPWERLERLFEAHEVTFGSDDDSDGSD